MTMDILDQLKSTPSNSFNILYADPPWSYQQTVKNGVLRRKDGSLLYPSMSVKQLCALGPEVARVGRNDSALFLWATMPLLAEALKVIDAWGYTYKTCFVTWIKTTKQGDRPAFGVGYYTRSNAELCLLATKGKIASYKKLLDIEVNRNASAMSSVVHEEGPCRPNFLTLLEDSSTPIVMTPRRQHSRKPQMVRSMIERLLGNIPRAELFAREQTEGWSALGNDVTHFEESDEQKTIANAKHARARKKRKKSSD